MERFCDLHTHTGHSREANNFTLNRLENYVESKKRLTGLILVSMLDHDTLNYLEPMYRNVSVFKSDELPIILPGIEITSAFDHPLKPSKVVQTHLLGYFPQLMTYDEETIRRVNALMAPVMARALNGKIAKNVSIRLGYFYKNEIIPVSYNFDSLKVKIMARIDKDAQFVEENEPKSKDIINWPINTSDLTLIEVLLQDGLLFSEQEGKLYTDRAHPEKAAKLAKILQQKQGLTVEQAQIEADKLQGCCHGSYNDPYDKLTTQEAIDVVTRAGGIAILAHPMASLKNWGNDIDSFFAFCNKHLVPLGLQGMEAFYPRQEGLTPQIIDFCEHNDLFITGGSDDHQDGRDVIGDARCPIKHIEKMLKKAL